MIDLRENEGVGAELIWKTADWSSVQCGSELLIHRHTPERVLDVATLHVEGLGEDWETRAALLPIVLYALTGDQSFSHRTTEYADLS